MRVLEKKNKKIAQNLNQTYKMVLGNKMKTEAVRNKMKKKGKGERKKKKRKRGRVIFFANI